MFFLGMSLQKMLFDSYYKKVFALETSLANQYVAFICNNNIKVSDFDITDSKGATKKISQILSKEKFVIYLGNIRCTSCVEKELMLMRTFFTNDEIQQNIILLGIFDSRKEQKITEAIVKIPTYHIDYPVPFSNTNDEDEILYCIVDSSMKVHNLIDMRKNTSDIDMTKIYYKAVAEKIKNRNEAAIFHQDRTLSEKGKRD